MKQYTSKDQTAKLIELGFPQPKSICLSSDNDIMVRGAYSIGELIEFLPQRNVVIKTPDDHGPNYAVYYKIRPSKGASRGELIYALFKACVRLKEEGVI